MVSNRRIHREYCASKDYQKHSRMGYVPPRTVRKIKCYQRVHLQNTPPLVHPTVNNLVEPFVEILDSHGWERNQRRHARELVGRLP